MTNLTLRVPGLEETQNWLAMKYPTMPEGELSRAALILSVCRAYSDGYNIKFKVGRVNLNVKGKQA